MLSCQLNDQLVTFELPKKKKKHLGKVPKWPQQLRGKTLEDDISEVIYKKDQIQRQPEIEH